MFRPVMEALAGLITGSPALIRRVVPWDRTTEARAAVERLLARWDEGEADALFSMNVELDEPLGRRRAEVERLQAIHGTLTPDTSVEPESHGPSHLAWWLRGERGRVRVEILMSPEHPTRVQGLSLTSVPDAPAVLADIARRLADALGTPSPAWPPDLRLAAGLDLDAIGRAMRAAEARFGPVVVGDPIASDGATRATWRLTGERGDLDLSLALDPGTGHLTAVAFVPRSMEPPIQAV